MFLKPCKWWDIYHINWLAGFLPAIVCHYSSHLQSKLKQVQFCTATECSDVGSLYMSDHAEQIWTAYLHDFGLFYHENITLVLVGGFNPFKKTARQIQKGMKIIKYFYYCVCSSKLIPIFFLKSSLIPGNHSWQTTHAAALPLSILNNQTQTTLSPPLVNVWLVGFKKRYASLSNMLTNQLS